MWAAGAAGLLALLVIVAGLVRRTASGQLRRVRADLAKATRTLRKARSVTENADARLRKLGKRSDKTKPRLLREAEEALEDARALEKIAGDKVMIAANHVRRVIHEEFPPSRHERLRHKFLPGDKPDGKPFRFDS